MILNTLVIFPLTSHLFYCRCTSYDAYALAMYHSISNILAELSTSFFSLSPSIYAYSYLSQPSVSALTNPSFLQKSPYLVSSLHLKTVEQYTQT